MSPDATGDIIRFDNGCITEHYQLKVTTFSGTNVCMLGKILRLFINLSTSLVYIMILHMMTSFSINMLTQTT